jgi:thioesterase domain-containing protein
LRRRGHQVPLVAIIDTPAPFVSETRDRLPWDDARWIAELAERIAKLLAPEMRLTEEALRTCARERGTEAAFALFRDTLVAAGAFPPEGEIASLQRTLDVFKAHSQVSYSVEEAPTPGIERLVLLRTNAPPSQIPWPSDDETWGWGRLAPTEVCCVPGDHLAVLRPPHVATLAERLAACAAATAAAATRGLAMTSA